VASVDMGAYDTCVYGCAYCYATGSLASARRRCAEHDPEDAMLWRPRNGAVTESGDASFRAEV
jgi:hypothetical protein